MGWIRRARNDRWRRRRGFDDSSGTWVAVGVAAILLAGCGGGGQSHPQASPAPAPSHSRSWNGWAGVSPTTVPPTTMPAPKPHQQAPRASRSAPAKGGCSLDYIRAHENPHDPSGSPYGRSTNPNHFGAYQFDRGTWAANGGDPSHWGNASPAEQDAVAANTYAARGSSPWAVC